MAVPIPVDLTVAAAPLGWGGNLQDLVSLFRESVSAELDPTYLIGQNGGPVPTHDMGPYFDGAEWWFWDPVTGQYQPDEQGSPIGTIAMWGGGGPGTNTPGVPASWLGCAGQPVSRQTYSRLYQAIGTTWGVGDGVSSFNLPPPAKFYINAASFKSAVQVPIDPMPTPAPPGVTATTYPAEGVAARGGAQLARLLLASDMPSGAFSQNNIGYGQLAAFLRWTIPVYNNTFPGDTQPNTPVPNLQPYGATSIDGTYNFRLADMQGDLLGPGQPDGQSQIPIMPPYVTINFIIKYQ